MGLADDVVGKLSAILERDPDAAEAALTNHLGDAWEQVRTTFDL